MALVGVAPEGLARHRVVIAVAPERVGEPARDAAAGDGPLHHQLHAAREPLQPVLVLRAGRSADDAAGDDAGFRAGAAQHVLLFAIVERHRGADGASEPLLDAEVVLIGALGLQPDAAGHAEHLVEVRELLVGARARSNLERRGGAPLRLEPGRRRRLIGEAPVIGADARRDRQARERRPPRRRMRAGRKTISRVVVELHQADSIRGQAAPHAAVVAALRFRPGRDVEPRPRNYGGVGAVGELTIAAVVQLEAGAVLVAEVIVGGEHALREDQARHRESPSRHADDRGVQADMDVVDLLCFGIVLEAGASGERGEIHALARRNVVGRSRLRVRESEAH